MIETLKPGDKVDWADNLGESGKRECIEDCGEGPYKVYETRMEGKRQLVSLVAESDGRDWAIDPRLQLRWPISDIDKYGKPPTVVAAMSLKKI